MPAGPNPAAPHTFRASTVAASVAAALAAVHRGAHIVRVHDVAATVDALKVWWAAEAGRLPG